MGFRDIFNLCSIQWFIFGLLFMDFRADHIILLGKATDEQVTAAYYHYNISTMGEKWYPLIMLGIFGIGILATIYRAFIFSSLWDWLQLFTSLISGGIFATLIVPEYEKMEKMTVESPQEYLPHLQIVAVGHCIVLILSITSLILIYFAYATQYDIAQQFKKQLNSKSKNNKSKKSKQKKNE